MTDAPPTAAQVYASAQAVIAFAGAFVDSTNAFWTLAADAGFHADGTPTTGPGDPLAGYVAVTNPAGVITYQACYAKLVATVGGKALDQRILRQSWFLGATS